MSQHPGLARVLAEVPWDVGFEPGPQDVVVWAEGRGTALISLEWPATPAKAYAPVAAQRVAQDIAGINPVTVLVISYGAGGDRRAEHLGIAIEQQVLDGQVGVLPVHVENDSFRIYIDTNEWSSPFALPPKTIAPILDGRPIPAATREEFQQRYAPLPTPLFDLPSPAEQSRLDRLAPSLRSDISLRTLDHLAERRPGDPPLDRGAFATQLATTPVVRHSALVHALTDPARVEVLVQLYRAAPEELREDLGATAAAAVLLANGPTQPAAALISQLRSTDSIAHGVRDLGRQGAPRGLIVDELRKQLPIALAKADQQHQAGSATRLTGHSPAPGVRPEAGGHQPPGRPTGTAEGPHIER